MWSTAVAIFAIGGMFGSVIGQIIANFLGRYMVNFRVIKYCKNKSLSSSLKLFSWHIFKIFFLIFLDSKRTLLLNNIPAIIGSLMIFSSYYAKGPALLIIGRLIFGFNNGKGFAASMLFIFFMMLVVVILLQHQISWQYKECHKVFIYWFN